MRPRGAWRSSPRIDRDLALRRANRTARHHFQPLVVAKRLLHQSVLKRMKTHDGQAAARTQAIGQPPQRHFQPFKLFIDGDPQCLKRSRGRIDAIGSAPRHGAADQLRELLRRSHRRLPPPRDDLAGNSPAVAFLAQLKEHVRQMFFTQSLEQPPRRFAAGRIESQIERSVAMETESALHVGQLVARHSQIEHDAVDRCQVTICEYLRQVGIVAVYALDRQCDSIVRRCVRQPPGLGRGRSRSHRSDGGS